MVFHFGTQQPMVVIERGGTTYMHMAQDPAQFQTVPSKKVQMRAFAKEKKARHELMLEARAMLKKSTMADIKGDAGASQCLRTKAANMGQGAVSLHAPTTMSYSELPSPMTRRTEGEVLEGLEIASKDLRRLVTNARSSDSPHPLRNYRRKYRKVL
jgi:hypothetical protein